MRKRGAVLLLFLLAIGVGWFVVRNLEPRYAGRPLNAWVKDLQHTTEQFAANPEAVAKEEVRARDAVVRIGTNAIPYLLAWLREDHAPTRIIRRALIDIGFVRDFHRSMADLTPAAFGALGPGARAAIPDLLQIVQSSSPDPRSRSQSRALLALTRIGPPAHPAIFSLLTHTNLQTRYQAVFRIRGFGSNAAPAIPVLIDALTQPPAYFQAAVAETLGRLRIEPATAVPTLLSAARSDDPDLRTAALKALARFGPDARPALPLLLEAWQTPGNDPKLRGAIEDALLLLAPDAITSAPLR